MIARKKALRLVGIWVALGCLAGGAATTSVAAGTTTRTRPFKRPPYYQGREAVTAAASVVHGATVVTPATGIPPGWLPLDAMRGLAADVDRFLEQESLSRAAGTALGADGRAVAPTVAFGCELDLVGECDTEARQNALTTTGGSKAWQERASQAIRLGGAEHAVLIELTLAPQWIQQKNLSGKKEVRLGTDHVQPLPWLTSLDSPVWVLQLTGALVDADGKVVRSGAEGVWAVRTPFRASILGAERLMSDRDVVFVREEWFRDDLPGRPLAWQAATRQLLRGLLARGSSVENAER